MWQDLIMADRCAQTFSKKSEDCADKEIITRNDKIVDKLVVSFIRNSFYCLFFVALGLFNVSIDPAKIFGGLAFFVFVAAFCYGWKIDKAKRRIADRELQREKEAA